MVYYTVMLQAISNRNRKVKDMKCKSMFHVLDARASFQTGYDTVRLVVFNVLQMKVLRQPLLQSWKGAKI